MSKSNRFNVPFHKERPRGYFAPTTLRSLASLLAGVDLRACSYTCIVENGLVYLDPPYEHVFQMYSNNPPMAGDLQTWIDAHKDSTILISNNQHYTPPANAQLLYKEVVFQRIKAERGVTREEYVYGIMSTSGSGS